MPTNDPKELKNRRDFAKKVVLGCGYGMGHKKFAETCQKDGLIIDLIAAKAAVDAFRRGHSAIQRFWNGKCKASLRILADRDPSRIRLGPVALQEGSLLLPNGIRCPFEIQHDGNGGFLRTDRYGTSSYWGGSFDEFLCQSLSRVLLSDVMKRAWDELGIRTCLHVHDEVIYATPAEQAEAIKDKLVEWMSESPAWFPELPLFAEGWVGRRYVRED